MTRRARVKAFSKIIHSAVATHFRLPAPITAMSGEGRQGRPTAAWREAASV